MRFLLPGLIIYLIPLSSISQTNGSFSVYFEFDSHALNKKALIQLDSFCRKNKKSIGHLEFEIKGYCDNRGTDKYNYTLSDKRVASVKKLLRKRGMNIEFMLVASGYGETEPLNENKTEEERQLNRRVDISITKSGDTMRGEKEKPISLKQKIADSTTRAGTNIILHNINFEGGMHQFLPESLLFGQLRQRRVWIRNRDEVRSRCIPHRRTHHVAEVRVRVPHQTRTPRFADHSQRRRPGLRGRRSAYSSGSRRRHAGARRVPAARIARGTRADTD